MREWKMEGGRRGEIGRKDLSGAFSQLGRRKFSYFLEGENIREKSRAM